MERDDVLLATALAQLAVAVASLARDILDGKDEDDESEDT